MRRARSVYRVAVVATVAVLTLAPAAAQGREHRLPPTRWANRVCSLTTPSVRALLADARSWPAGPQSVTSLPDAVARIGTVDRALGAIAQLVEVTRSAIVRAGVPAVRDGAGTVARVNTALRALHNRIQKTRNALGRFRVEVQRDPRAALGRLRLALQNAGSSLNFRLPSELLPASLRRAFDASRRCTQANGVAREFAIVVKGKLAGGSG